MTQEEFEKAVREELGGEPTYPPPPHRGAGADWPDGLRLAIATRAGCATDWSGALLLLRYLREDHLAEQAA